MRLHENKNLFAELIQGTASGIGLPQIYIEKDYWVTKSLRALARSEYSDDAVFKGGTSLSKAYRLIDRFSEDIDLAIIRKNQIGNAHKALIKNIETVACKGLEAIDNDHRISKGSTFRKTVYRYPREITGENFGQASAELLIEINAFSQPQPVERKQLQPFMADFLMEQGRSEFIEEFGLQPFEMNVLSVKRTLVEKMLTMIKDSYDDSPVTRLGNRIRHLYDIAQILSHDEYQNFITSDEFHALCETCVHDEVRGAFDNARCLDKPLSEAPIFTEFDRWHDQLNRVYQGIFADLVYGDLPSMDQIGQSLNSLQASLKMR